jgi:hypothetical protein
MSTADPNTSQPIQPNIMPQIVPPSALGIDSPRKYPQGVTEEEIQIALKRRAEGGTYWTTKEVLQQLRSLGAK